MDYKPETEDEFEQAVVLAKRFNILHENKLRDANIRREYVKLRREFVTFEQAVWQLSEKHCLAFRTIEGIVQKINHKDGTSKRA